MGRPLDLIKGMLGAAPKKPEKVSEKVQKIMFLKYEDKDRYIKEKLHARAHHETSHKWRNRRWAVLIATNLLFVFSFWLDIQILEGALTASRFVGFHLIDLNSALHVMLAHKHIIVNLFIGTFTVFLLWVLLGGRSFCSWVCPYHLLAEWTEKLHLWLVERKIVTDHEFHRGTRTVFWLLFALLSVVTGYTIFETLSPTGILSRALIYGPGLAMGWVFLLLLFVTIEQNRGFWTVTLAHATFAAAYVAVVVQSRLLTFDAVLEEAAMDLGAPPAKTFFVITLPMIMPAVISGWLLAFTLSLDDLVIASFVSGPGATTLPMLVFSSVRMGVNPEINALATLILGVVGIIGFIAWYQMARTEKQRIRDIQRARRG